MQACPAIRTGSRSGFTLIELLVAMAAALVLAGVAGALLFGILRTLDVQARWRAQALPAGAAVEALAADLAGAAAPWGATSPVFRLEPSPAAGAPWSLRVLTASPDGRGAYALQDVAYAAGAGSGLVRVARAFRDGLGAPRTDRWEQADAVRIEVFDGQAWTDAWPAARAAGLPRAARITLPAAPAGGTEVLIPAGCPIERPPGR